MTRDEFLDGIYECDDLLWIERIKSGWYLCDAINEVMPSLFPFFRSRLKPGLTPCGLWWGYSEYIENQAERHIALHLFKEICLSEKLYENF